jgi:hypothetical protein
LRILARDPAAALLKAEQIANSSDAKRHSDVEEALRKLKA